MRKTQTAVAHILKNSLQPVQWQKFTERGVGLWVWREDLNHPHISGNKWYKIQHQLKQVALGSFSGVVSMGGPWSNHLHALAAACHEQGIPAVGFVRGDALKFLSATIEDALGWGMDIRFLDFDTYRALREQGNRHPLVSALGSSHYFIPEGGSDAGVQMAFKPLVDHIEAQLSADYWICPTGTGGTLAGLINHCSPETCIIGVQAVAEGAATEDRIAPWIAAKRNAAPWQLWHNYHRGGFGKVDTALRHFIDAIEQRFGLPLDPVYNGKAMMAVSDALDRGFFKAGQQVVLIHTGGLQGLRGMPRMTQAERGSTEGRALRAGWGL